MKAATQAWYWLAAGVLALGLNGYYQDGGLPVLHRLANCGETRDSKTGVLRRMATVAEGAMAGPARLCCNRTAEAALVAVSPGIPPRAQARLAQLQERVGEMQAARIQARIARVQQAMAQRERQRGQVEWQDGRLSVVSDEGWVQVTVPQLPRVEVNVPQAPVVDVSQPN
jgi:hypothetical protein